MPALLSQKPALRAQAAIAALLHIVSGFKLAPFLVRFLVPIARPQRKTRPPPIPPLFTAARFRAGLAAAPAPCFETALGFAAFQDVGERVAMLEQKGAIRRTDDAATAAL